MWPCFLDGDGLVTSDTRLVTEERTSKLRSEATESACDREASETHYNQQSRVK